MPLECLLLNITLRDLPGKCKKKTRKMRENADRIPPPPPIVPRTGPGTKALGSAQSVAGEGGTSSQTRLTQGVDCGRRVEPQVAGIHPLPLWNNNSPAVIHQPHHRLDQARRHADVHTPRPSGVQHEAGVSVLVECSLQRSAVQCLQTPEGRCFAVQSFGRWPFIESRFVAVSTGLLAPGE